MAQQSIDDSVSNYNPESTKGLVDLPSFISLVFILSVFQQKTLYLSSHVKLHMMNVSRGNESCVQEFNLSPRLKS